MYFFYRHSRFLSLLAFVCLWLLIAIKSPRIAEAQSLYLNEIMASNGNSIMDEDGDTEDWVELFYNGTEPLNLQGYGLSDDYDRPFRWVFPDITMQPGDFLLVWASGKDRTDPQSELHTNFAIAADGEEVILTAPDEERLDELPPTRIPTDISLGRYPDGTGEWFFYTQPTPHLTNRETGYRELLDPVSFSHDAGFYSEDFDLELDHPDPDVTIIYTLDGSEPDPENLDGTTYQHMDRYRPAGNLLDKTFESLVYDDENQPLTVTNRINEPNYFSRMQSAFEDNTTPYYFPDNPVSKGTVVRAKAVKAGAISDGIQTHSYFVTPLGRDRYSLPVISFGIQENHLFDYEDGIYVPGKIYNDRNPWQDDGGADANYGERGIEWERPGSLELIETGSQYTDLQQDIGVRIHGGWSRAHPMKSLRLYARNQYSDNRFYHRMFPDEPYNQFNRLMLRNSGNDWPQSMVRDAIIQEVIGHMAFDTQAYRPFVIFLNGEYWGIHNMRERYDKHYLERVHGVDPENIDLLEGNAWVKEGDSHHYDNTISYIRSNGVEEERHFEHIKTRIDIENFMDYQIGQIFSRNTDWPGNNIDFWRLRTDEYDPDAPDQHDGRWRWLAFDLDFGFNIWGNSPTHNTLAFATQAGNHDWPNPDWSTFLLRKLLENDSFRTDFINRYLDQLNTAFRSDRVIRIIDEMAGHIEPEMQEHIDRWSRPTSFHSWQSDINSMRSFANDRPGYARRHLRDHFGIRSQQQHQMTVDVSAPAAGRVRVNTIELSPETAGVEPDPWPWTGTYFEDVPVTLEARPWPGYTFSHWEGVESDIRHDREIEINLTNNRSVTAFFQREEDPKVLPQAFRIIPESPAYTFEQWPMDAEAGSFPEHMAFVYMDEHDPGLRAGISGFTSGIYDLNERTRINGHNHDGFSFINTGNEEGNPGYPGTRLGGALLALNTANASNIQINWEGMTVTPNSRVYALRLQYRIGDEGPFTDVRDDQGDPVEYQRNPQEGHHEWTGPVMLPEEAEDKGYVQLLWRYYYTGERLSEESGARDQLAVRNITIEAMDVLSADEETPDHPESFKLRQNYPNPFNPTTTISYDLPESSHVRLDVFDMLGRHVATLRDGPEQPGRHQVHYDASDLSSGMYLYRLEAGGYVETRKMTVIK